MQARMYDERAEQASISRRTNAGDDAENAVAVGDVVSVQRAGNRPHDKLGEHRLLRLR